MSKNKKNEIVSVKDYHTKCSVAISVREKGEPIAVF